MSKNELLQVAGHLTSPAKITRLGLRLGVESEEIEAALTDNPDILMASQGVLQIWRGRHAGGAVYARAVLVRALRERHFYSIIRDVFGGESLD